MVVLQPSAVDKEHLPSFIHFLRGLLNIDPKTRWTPSQALNHPFIKNIPFDEAWEPDPLMKPEYIISEIMITNSILPQKNLPFTDGLNFSGVQVKFFSSQPRKPFSRISRTEMATLQVQLK